MKGSWRASSTKDEVVGSFGSGTLDDKNNSPMRLWSSDESKLADVRSKREDGGKSSKMTRGKCSSRRPSLSFCLGRRSPSPADMEV